MIALKERWQSVAEIEAQELRTATVETKWRQLNSIISITIRMGITRPDPNGELVYQQWAKLKEQAGRPCP